MQDAGTPSTSRVAFRFNPLVGAGTIQALSVSDQQSKFGIPLTEGPQLPLIRMPFVCAFDFEVEAAHIPCRISHGSKLGGAHSQIWVGR